MPEIPSADIISLIWFVAVWIGYTWYADRGPWRQHSLRAVMHRHREEWRMCPGKKDGIHDVALPAVSRRNNDALETWVTREEINCCVSQGDFARLVRAKLQARE